MVHPWKVSLLLLCSASSVLAKVTRPVASGNNAGEDLGTDVEQLQTWAQNFEITQNANTNTTQQSIQIIFKEIAKLAKTVAFDVVLDKRQDSHGPIKFTRTVANIGNSMDAGKGIFTAPVAGIYEFTFSAWNQNMNKASDVYFYKNNELVARTFSYALGVYGTHFMENLGQGDTISSRLNRGAIHGDFGRATRFTGKLLRQLE